jgi:hypothetical protein
MISHFSSFSLQAQGLLKPSALKPWVNCIQLGPCTAPPTAHEQQVVEQALRRGEHAVRDEVKQNSSDGMLLLVRTLLMLRRGRRHRVLGRHQRASAVEVIVVLGGAAEAERGRPRVPGAETIRHYELLYRHSGNGEPSPAQICTQKTKTL